MNNTLLNIKEFFDWLYRYNWHQFNSIEDGFEQAKEYRGILNRFKVLVLQETIHEGFDSNELYNLIQSQQAIATLPFMGKLHTFVNPYLMKGQLIERVQKVMFETEKKKLSEGICECERQHSYGQYPDFKNLIKTGTYSDGYYEYTVYECKKCHFQWCAYLTDDDAGQTKITKYDT